MAKPVNLQDAFLNHLRRENIGVVIYLLNGVQLRGTIRGFDNYCLLLESAGKVQLVYKHAITTVQPVKKIPDVYTLAVREQEEEEGVAEA
ncbi:MAG TPA: RNA chaperone Hfq [Armatimonadetes bacterium]|nr:RNA chaperone Hfq [Armatimonadota bacterium]